MSIEYKWRDDGSECALCGSLVPLAPFDNPLDQRDKEPAYFCELCSGTIASRAYWYKHLSQHQPVMAVICGVGNAILKAMGKFGPRPEPPESDDG